MQLIYAAVAVFVLGALVALLIYHVAVVRPALERFGRLLELHDGLIAGGAGGAASRFAALEEAHAANGAGLKSVTDRVDALDTFAGKDLSRAGFVRYDAFNDSESGLSYALALLNREGDGVVLTSIHSRADTRTYGKTVTRFKPTVHASTEELEAIELARTQQQGVTTP